MKAWCLAKMDERKVPRTAPTKTRDFCALSFPFWLSDSVLQSGHSCIQNGTSEECLDVRLRENRIELTAPRDTQLHRVYGKSTLRNALSMSVQKGIAIAQDGTGQRAVTGAVT